MQEISVKFKDMIRRVFRRNANPSIKTSVQRIRSRERIVTPTELYHNYNIGIGYMNNVTAEAPKQVKVDDSKYNIEPIIVETTQSTVSMQTKAMGEVAQIIPSPTGNCQIQSVVNFMNILAYYDRANGLYLLAKGWKKSGVKTELLIDIPTTYEKKLEEMFLFSENDILLKAPYKNNTGTEMIIYLVQIKRVLEREGLI